MPRYLVNQSVGKVSKESETGNKLGKGLFFLIKKNKSNFWFYSKLFGCWFFFLVPQTTTSFT